MPKHKFDYLSDLSGDKSIKKLVDEIKRLEQELEEIKRLEQQQLEEERKKKKCSPDCQCNCGNA